MRRGLRIGLFGGSFDPPHAAHRAASLFAMRRLGLDRVWWMVTPGNPLKDTGGLPRWSSASRRHKRWRITRASTSPTSRRGIGTRYTSTRCASWTPLSAGAFRLADGGRQPGQLPPLAELARHCGAGADRRGRSGRPEPRAHRRPRRRRRSRATGCPSTAARTLAGRRPPAWVVLHGLKLPLSSTALRARKCA